MYLKHATNHIQKRCIQAKTKLKLIKKILIGILLIGIISSIGFLIFLTNFELFARVPVKKIKEECDKSKIRKVAMYELSGNATTNGTIYMSVSKCDEIDFENSELIFSVSSSNINQEDIKFEWISLDTLKIMYNKNLEVFKQKTESEFVKRKIIFEYIPE